MAPKSAAKKKMITKVTAARYQVQIFRFLFEKNGENSGIRLAMIIGSRIMLIHLRSKRSPRNSEGKRSVQCSPSGLKAIRVKNLYTVKMTVKITSRLKTQSNV